VRGLRPRNAPSPKTPRRRECVGNTTLTTRCDPRLLRLVARSEYVPAQARQLPNIPSVHRYDHQEPATEILTVHSAQADRTMNMP